MAEGQKELLQWKDSAGTLHSLSVDVITGHVADNESEITSFPVEFGADINDHIIHMPTKLTLEVVQTQTPFEQMGPLVFTPNKQLGRATRTTAGFSVKSVELTPQPNAFKPGGLLAATRAIGSAISAGLGALGLGAITNPPLRVNVLQADQEVDRIGELEDKLIDLNTNGYLIDVTYRNRVFPSMVLTKVSSTSTKGEVGLGRFSLTFQNLRTVATSSTKLPDPASMRLKPAAKQTKPAKKVDAATTGVSSDAAKGPGESMLSALGVPSA